MPQISELEQSTPALFCRYFIVINPSSGSSQAEALRHYAKEGASARSKEVAFHELSPGDDLGSVLDRAVSDGAEVLVAAGGDGTLAAVATEAYRLKKVFGAIPCGTANVFAAEHFLPKSMEAAVDFLFDAPSYRAIDILLVDARVFLCHISIGTYSWITLKTRAELKKKYGRIVYLWNTISIMRKEKSWTFHLEIDGQKMDKRASTIMAANAGSIGATGLRWGENISTSDGLVEICIIRARSFRHYLALFWSLLLRRKHHPLKEYIAVRREATIEGPKSLPVRADGEHVADGSIHFKLIPRGLQVIVPARESAAHARL